MKISIGAIKLMRFRALRISREQMALFGLFALAAAFVTLFWFGALTVWRNQHLLIEPPKAESGWRVEFHEDRLEKALEIINAREKWQK